MNMEGRGQHPVRPPRSRRHQQKGGGIKPSRISARIRWVFVCWSIDRSLTCLGRSEMKFARLSVRPLLHRQRKVQWTD